MRDILNLLDTLNEAAVGMSAGEITKYETRIEKFLNKITLGEPFTTIDNQEVVIDPAEAKRFLTLYKQNLFKGSLKARIANSNDEIALSKLAKTAEFGGAAVAVGQDPDTAGKEALLVKPKTIQITDFDIPAGNLHKVIASNQILNSTDYGKVVVELANNIVGGRAVRLPDAYQDKSMEKVRKAIVDYAGEYLGVLALVSGRTRFNNQDQFLEWLGGSLSQLTINFPGKSNTNIADSYATIKNKNTDHSLNISSKGTGGGAAPAISGLKISDNIKKNRKLANAVKFIEICKAKADARGASTLIQAFEAMNFVYGINPGSISKKFHKFLPWQSSAVAVIVDAVASDQALPTKYQTAFADIKARGDATDGGKLVYAIKKDVAEAINDRNAIPEFKKTILQVLEMNFIQQYTDYTKGGELVFETQWPAKLDGDISVVNKSSAVAPTSGGFSFKLGRVTSADEPGADGAVAPGKKAAAPSVVTGKRTQIRPKGIAQVEPRSAPQAGVGREKRGRR